MQTGTHSYAELKDACRIIDDYDQAQIIARQHEIFHNIMPEFSHLGRTRFSENGKSWQRLRTPTQTAYNKYWPQQTEGALAVGMYSPQGADTIFSLSDLHEIVTAHYANEFLKIFSSNVPIRDSLRFIQKMRGHSTALHNKSLFGTPIPEEELFSLHATLNTYASQLRGDPRINAFIETSKQSNQDLEPSEITLDFMLNMIAAVETMSATTLWAIHFLSKVAAEPSTGAGANTGSQEFSVTGILQETMRLMPAVPFIGRRVMRPTTIGNRNFEQGQIILISLFGIGRDPNRWDHPTTFRSDRFTSADVRDQHPMMPFFYGERGCGGQRLAMTLMQQCLASILTDFDVLKRREENVFQFAFTIKPTHCRKPILRLK